MAKLKDYDIKKLSIVIGTSHVVSGYASGVAATAAPVDPETYAVVTSQDGISHRIKNYNNDVIITLRLLISSTSNPVLSALMNTDRATNLGKVPMSYLDDNTGSYARSPECFVYRVAEISSGADGSEREWQLYFQNADYNVGGLV